MGWAPLCWRARLHTSIQQASHLIPDLYCHLYLILYSILYPILYSPTTTGAAPNPNLMEWKVGLSGNGQDICLDAPRLEALQSCRELMPGECGYLAIKVVTNCQANEFIEVQHLPFSGHFTRSTGEYLAALTAQLGRKPVFGPYSAYESHQQGIPCISSTQSSHTRTSSQHSSATLDSSSTSSQKSRRRGGSNSRVGTIANQARLTDVIPDARGAWVNGLLQRHGRAFTGVKPVHSL